MQDADDMTLGMWVDFVIEWNNMHRNDYGDAGGGKERDCNRRARQADFDRF